MRKGFTLLEVLLTATFLIFTASTILILFVNCIFLNASSRDLTTATSHAQMVMEEIKGTNFSAVETNINNNYWDWDSATIASKGLVVLPAEAIVTTEIGASSNLLNVVVTVSWTERGQRNKNVSMETLLAEL